MGDAARQVLGTCRYQGENGREALPSCPRIHTPGIRDKASASPAFMQRISSSIRIDTSANGPSSRFPNRRCRVSVQYRKLDQSQGHVSRAPCFHHQSQPFSVVVSRCPVWACLEGVQSTKTAGKASRAAVATSRRPEVACRLGRVLDYIRISGTKEVRSAMWSTKASFFNVSLLIESLALSLTPFVVIVLDCLSGQ